MEPNLTRAFLDWLVTYLTLALRGRGGAQQAREETVTAPLPGAVATTAGVRPRNSNAFRRPGEATHTYQAAGETWSLGDDPRTPPPVMPRRPQPPVPADYIAAPQPFAGLATQNELTDFYAENEGHYLTVFAKGLLPHSGESGVADFPCEDAVREKLWRRRDMRDGLAAAWGEWEYITQEYPSEPHPYQSGRDDDGPYVAGIMTQDWRYLRVSDVMPLFLDDDDKLWVPDHGHVLNWLADPTTITAGLTLTPPIISVDNSGSHENRAPYTTQQFDFLSMDTFDMMGAAIDVNQPVKHYRRGDAETVRQATFERREHTFNDSGSDSMDVDGTLTLNAGEHMTLNSLPGAWWHTDLFVGATVVGSYTGEDEIRVSFASPAFRTFLEDNETPVRFTSSSNIAGPAVVLDVDDRGGAGTWLILDRPVTVGNNWSVQRYSVATPKVGSRTYYVHDEASFAWQQFTLVQVYVQTATLLIYFVRPATALTLSRRQRLYEGSDDSGTLLHDLEIEDGETYGIASYSSDGGQFSLTTSGITSGGPIGLTSGAGGQIQFVSGTAQFGGDLPECTFLREFSGLLPGVTARQYRFDGPVVTMNLKPIPADSEEGIQPSDYGIIPPWAHPQEWGMPWHEWTGLVNPLIYDGEHGTLHNPAAAESDLGSEWLGLEWATRWYCADALLGPDGQLIGLALLEDDDFTLLVSVDGTPAWSGSVFDLLPCGGESFAVSYPGEGGPGTWPPTVSRNDIYRVAPHYNFLHPSWPFPTALVGPFAVRARVADDRAGVNWSSGVPTPPVVVTPIF